MNTSQAPAGLVVSIVPPLVTAKRLNGSKQYRPCVPLSDLELLQETWRRITMAFDRLPKLEMQLLNSNNAMQSLGNQLQQDRQSWNLCRTTLSETEAALVIAEGVRDQLEQDCYEASRERERLEAALSESVEKGRDLEEMKEDLFDIKEQLEQAIADKKEEKLKANCEYQNLLQENIDLKNAIQTLRQQLLVGGAEEAIVVEPAPRAATPFIGSHWRSQSLSPNRRTQHGRVGKRRTARVTSVEQLLNSEESASTPLLEHYAEEEEEEEEDAEGEDTY